MYMVDLIEIYLSVGQSAEGPTHGFLSPYFQARTHTMMGVSFSARGQQNDYPAGYVRIFILWTRDGAPPIPPLAFLLVRTSFFARIKSVE